ncbi:phosphoglucomutase/phosphomannomutase family protein [Halorubellus sp. JP-L1]|uniref:phosphoglucomutase/phosphomannomutase family protein n=1 Tax=Halorubellus sp. JP-L1 TaxID=2715753 RepID=UPI0014089F00|nr:phosphoglucomutase/phosphomannomutase family protein [Halorubellus sp. JP-L1]NHN43463.1 phosphoglucomutase/phosphomannomutase family protein [Halorubellus sp. JP-L1]
MDAIQFGTDGWRATLDEFTERRVRIVAQGVAGYLQDAGRAGETVGVGYDARETSEGFAEELARVLCANGFDVVMPERDRPTPQLAWAIRDRDLAGGCMITASHNPPEYNGVKFVSDDGSPALAAETDAIVDHLAEPDPLPESEWGDVERVDVVTPHFEQCRRRIAELADVGADDGDATSDESTTDLLDGLHVVYDAIHGSGRDTTDALLEACGASVDRLRCERDPDFGGAHPEPSEENLQGLVDAVRERDADLGVANDGDADRIAVVTPDGFLDENLFFAAIYDYLLERESGSAVRTVSTTFLVDRVADAYGETVHETPVGFKYVAEAMADFDPLMAGEESGGFAVRGHLRQKDGVFMALLAAAAAVDRPLEDRVSDLLAEHGEIHQGKESVDCPDDRKQDVLAALEDHIPDAVAGEPVADVVTVDGFKLLLEDGSWTLMRPSGTEPKLRVYAEAESEARVEALLDAGRDLVEPLV